MKNHPSKNPSKNFAQQIAEMTVDELTYCMIRDALEKTSGNRTQTAKLLGISPAWVDKAIQRN
jgi:DNA-binding NtrC family response regulator